MVVVEDMVSEEAITISRIGGRFGDRGAFEQVGGPKITCHYLQEGHTKFTC